MRAYSEWGEKVRAKLKSSGVELEFIRMPLNQNTAEPWKIEQLDAVTVKASALVLPPSSASSLGFNVSYQELIQQSKAILIVSQPETKEDLRDFQNVKMEDKIYKLNTIEALSPDADPDAIILYYMWVEK